MQLCSFDYWISMLISGHHKNWDWHVYLVLWASGLGIINVSFTWKDRPFLARSINLVLEENQFVKLLPARSTLWSDHPTFNLCPLSFLSSIEGEYVPIEGDEVNYKICSIPPKLEAVQAVEVTITHLKPGTKHETWAGHVISSWGDLEDCDEEKSLEGLRGSMVNMWSCGWRDTKFSSLWTDQTVERHLI